MVSDPLLTDSANNGSERKNRSAPISYTEIFNEHFPYYLSIGMTEEQYWDRDCSLVKYYREADKLKRERENQNMWLQGMYIYDAISRLVPVLHAFAKKGTQAKPYVDAPYPLTKKAEKQAKVEKEKATASKGLAYMQQLMAKSLKRFGERK